MKSSPQKRNPTPAPKAKALSAPVSSSNLAGKRPTPGLEGEGSYSATRDYNRHLEQDLKSRDVSKSAAKARRALEGSEARELSEAEKKGKRGPDSEREDEEQLPISDPLR